MSIMNNVNDNSLLQTSDSDAGSCIPFTRLPKEGDIYFIRESGAEVGREEKKTRPCILLKYYNYSGTWEVVPLVPGWKTRANRDNAEWFRTDASGRDSIANIGQRKVVDPSRILPDPYLGCLTPEELSELKVRVRACYLELESS